MLRRPTRRKERDEQGLVAVIFALTAVILLLIAGLVVDLGLARDTRRQSQNAADASSLAGAGKLYPPGGVCVLDPAPKVAPCFVDAVAAATAYALQNFQVSAANWASCTDAGHYYYAPGASPCISFADDSLATTKPTQPTKIRVVIPTRNVPTGFGTLAGITNIPISTSARAAMVPGAARSCGLCLLGSDVSDLGNGDVTVTGGSVYSNGSIDSGPNGVMSAGPSPMTITTVGTCGGTCQPTATTGAAPISDPYGTSLALPPSMAGLTVKTDPCTQGPGIYPAIALPNSLCVLTPGLYVMTGTWDMKNSTILRGITGVTLYGTCGTPAAPAVCTTGQTGGHLDTKNGETQLIAPTAATAVSGSLPGYAIIYDRANVGGLNIQGNGNSYVTGTIYAPKALLEFPGTSCVTITNGPVIVGQLYGNGNTGCVNLTSVNGANLPSPPDGSSLDQ